MTETSNTNTLGEIEYPLGVVMHDENQRTRIAEALLTTKRALPVAEISRRAQCPQETTVEVLEVFESFGIVQQTTFGVFRWCRGSSVGRSLTRLRELLHAEMYPESWSAEIENDRDRGRGGC